MLAPPLKCVFLSFWETQVSKSFGFACAIRCPKSACTPFEMCVLVILGNPSEQKFWFCMRNKVPEKCLHPLKNVCFGHFGKPKLAKVFGFACPKSACTPFKMCVLKIYGHRKSQKFTFRVLGLAFLPLPLW